MGSIDNTTWQILTLTLTLIGVVSTVLLWRMRGPASAVRGLAWTLLPAAAYLTGTLRLGWEVVDAVASWAVRFAFSPFVWLGIAIAGVSATLFVVAAQMRKRGVGTRGRAPKSAAGSSGRQLPARTSKEPAGPASSASGDAGDLGDMDDIEAILRKHGIT